MPDGFRTALDAVTSALFLLAGIYIYLSLVRQISARRSDPAAEPARTFGLPEAILSLGLASMFVFLAVISPAEGNEVVFQTNQLIFQVLFSVGLSLILVVFLRFRGLNLDLLGGFSRLGFWRSLLTSGILVFAAFPFIAIADLVSRRVLGGTTTRQGIVEHFAGSETIEQRALIIVLAVVVAPAIEEFVFRFFLYGTAKRYLGRFVGLLANAALFAAVHAHVPSALPLFVLGSCFTLAYEWSGSIIVPMTMHALFNSFTLVALAFPEIFPQ